MDFSQLPKMSDTPKPPPKDEDESQPAAPAPQRRTGYPPMDGALGFGFASVWISLVLGLILMMLGANFARWSSATITGKSFPTGVEWSAGEKAGQMVEYFDLQGGTAWSETGLFLMGVALVLDAALMFAFYRRGRPSNLLLFAAILATGLALGLNVLVAIKLLSAGIMPLTTMCAVLVGGMMLFDHVPMLGMKRR